MIGGRLLARVKPPWPTPGRRALLELGLALVVALAGAGLFVWGGLPLPWMLGALFATTLASLAHLPVTVPQAVRAPMSGVLGVLLGSSFTAEVLDGLLLWVPSLAALPLYIAVTSTLAIFVLRRAAKLDRVTAYFSSTPGGLGEMIILGDRMGGDLRTISLIHATRILLVVFTVPFAIQSLEGVTVTGTGAADAAPLGAVDFVWLLVAGFGGALLASLLRLPAPMLLGPMVLSSALHVTGVVHGAPPGALVAIAQLLIGASVGCRFRGVGAVQVARAMAASLGVTVVMLAVSVAFAFGLAPLTGLPLTLLLLAYAPGGLAEMAIIALALGADATFVATHHIVRIALVVALASVGFRIYRRVVGIGGSGLAAVGSEVSPHHNPLPQAGEGVDGKDSTGPR